MSKPYDAIVAGAGIVGLSAARALAREGRRVLLLDRGTPGAEASGAAAGMLAPQIEASASDPMLPLTLAGRDAYRPLVRDLAQAGHPVDLEFGGIALVAFDDHRAHELVDEVAAQRRMGLDTRWLDQAALRKHQPGIGPAALGALLAPGDGRVDQVALCDALFADGKREGVTFERAVVTGIAIAQGRVTGVRTAAGARDAAAVVLAAGSWSPEIEGLPHRVPVEPVRGQMAAAPWPAGLPRTVLFGRGAYVVPRGGEAILGSTMEHSGFDKHTTSAGLSHIREETEALLPALHHATWTRTWAGLRPVTPDMRPVIGIDPDVRGLVYATGHGRNGILLGPITGDIVRDLVVRGETRWDLTPYLVTRFDKAA